MAEYYRPGMTVGASWSFLQYWSCVDFAFLGAWEGVPSKGQGVSVQRLSSSSYNKEERARQQGEGKGDLFPLTTDEPQRWGFRVYGLGWFLERDWKSQAVLKSLRLEIKAANHSPSQ
jgi:hypothetical protein